MPGRAADQQRDARTRQRQQGGEVRGGIGQPGFVHRVEAAQHRDHVGAAQAVVFGGDHQVPVARVDARVQDLHREGAALAQQTGGQGALAAAADRQHGGRLQRMGKPGTERIDCAGQAPWRQPPPRRSRPQRRDVRIRHSQGAGQGLGLAQVAGVAVGEQPGRVRGGRLLR